VAVATKIASGGDFGTTIAMTGRQYFRILLKNTSQKKRAIQTTGQLFLSGFMNSSVKKD
jgi:hypothetical protein